eukprot:Awhi_evm1s15394
MLLSLSENYSENYSESGLSLLTINNDFDLSNNKSDSETTLAEEQRDLNEIKHVPKIGPTTKTISKGNRTKLTLCTRSTPVVLRSSLRKNNLRSATLRKNKRK